MSFVRRILNQAAQNSSLKQAKASYQSFNSEKLIRYDQQRL
jgi:hypothetical protein